MAKYEIALVGGTLAAKSHREMVARIEAEANFWSVFVGLNRRDLDPNQYNTPPWANEALAYIKELSSYWPSHVLQLKAVDPHDSDGFLRLKATIENKKDAPPYSASRLASVARQLFESGKKQEAVSLLVGASSRKFAQLDSAMNGHAGQSAYVSFGRSLAVFLDLEQEANRLSTAVFCASDDAKLSKNIAGDLSLLFEEASASRDNYFSSFELSLKENLGKLKRLRESEIKYFRNTRREEAERRNKQTDELNSLLETFNAHLRLKRPVELWKERCDEHRTSSNSAWSRFIWGAIVLLLAAATVAFFLGDEIARSFILTGCELGTEPQCSRISARGPLNISMILVGTTVWLWFLRLQMRIFLSERHLSLDARERMAFAETYLSLLKGGEVSREHETVVLQSLMRPTQDGIIKDEGGPDFALSSMLAKALERK